MSGFDKDEFCKQILLMYERARDNDFFLKLNEDEVRELKSLYIDLYIPLENIGHYDSEQITKKLMTAIVSVYKHDKAPMSDGGDVIQLVDSVKYDGRNLYLSFAKISKAKMRRFELEKTQKQIAERAGCSVSTIRNCEAYVCDLSRQPENLVNKLAKALECSVEDII